MWCCAVVRVSLLERNMVKISKFAQVCFYLEIILLGVNFGLWHVLHTGIILIFSLKFAKFNLVLKSHFTALRVQTIWRLES